MCRTLQVSFSHFSGWCWNSADVCTVRCLYSNSCPTSPILTRFFRVCRCNQYCPNDIIHTIDSIREAVYSDILSAIRITFKCLGASEDQLKGTVQEFNLAARPAMCICQLVKILAPEWRKQAAKNPNANKDLLCTAGDPFETIINRVMDEIGGMFQKGAEELGDAILGATESLLGGLFSFFGQKPPQILPRVCLTLPLSIRNPKQHVKNCASSWAKATEELVKMECEQANPKWKRCYYERVREICMKDEYVQGYYALFDKGFESKSALQQSFSDAFGDAFDDPATSATLGSIFSAATREISAPEQSDLFERQNICSGDTLLHSLPLDQVRARNSTHCHSHSDSPPSSPALLKVDHQLSIRVL